MITLLKQITGLNVFCKDSKKAPFKWESLYLEIILSAFKVSMDVGTGGRAQRAHDPPRFCNKQRSALLFSENATFFLRKKVTLNCRAPPPKYEMLPTSLKISTYFSACLSKRKVLICEDLPFIYIKLLNISWIFFNPQPIKCVNFFWLTRIQMILNTKRKFGRFSHIFFNLKPHESIFQCHLHKKSSVNKVIFLMKQCVINAS